MTARAMVIVALIAASQLGCGSEDGGGTIDVSAHALDGEGCAACGMIVREQPAPRAQLVHRDGTRAYFCSISDLLSYLDVPSSHGAPQRIYVEPLDPEAADPLAHDTGEHAWIAAEDASYVTHVDRVGVMGVPALTYAERADAERVAERLGARVPGGPTRPHAPG